MRELLIRYLLGELDPIEQQALQQQLAESPALRNELAHLRTCFASSRQDEECDALCAEPPRGLAERTTERVTNIDGDEAEWWAASQAAAEVSDPPAGALGWSLADLTVAGGVVLAVSMLLFPALRESRDGTRRHVCQNNQQQMWMLVANYAQDHGGYVPPVKPNENAGIYTVRLVEKGYTTPDKLALLLFCPAAPLADRVRAKQFAIQIPTQAELAAMSETELAEARKKMSPFFAYRFPYRVGPNYHYVRDDRQQFSPLFSDTSGAEQDDLMSPNHGGSIVQVTYQDGSVRSLRSCVLPGLNDNLYRNKLGMVAAGLDRQDTVLGSSEATPEVVATSSR